MTDISVQVANSPVGNVRYGQNPDGSVAPYTGVEVAGAAVSAANPLPVKAPQPASGYTVASATTGNVKASAGTLFSALATNANAAVRYLQLWDGAAGVGTLKAFAMLPAGNGVTPGAWELNTAHFGAAGIAFGTSITWAISTAPTTYSAGTAADHAVSALYN